MAALDSADASLKVAESRYQDAIEEVRNRQAILEQRRTELELTRQAVRDSSLTSPLEGMVRERHVTAGQYLAAGSPVVTIVRMHPLRLRVAVPEREAQSVRVNQTVRVTVDRANAPPSGVAVVTVKLSGPAPDAVLVPVSWGGPVAKEPPVDVRTQGSKP